MFATGNDSPRIWLCTLISDPSLQDGFSALGFVLNGFFGFRFGGSTGFLADRCARNDQL